MSEPKQNEGSAENEIVAAEVLMNMSLYDSDRTLRRLTSADWELGGIGEIDDFDLLKSVFEEDTDVDRNTLNNLPEVDGGYIYDAPKVHSGIVNTTTTEVSTVIKPTDDDVLFGQGGNRHAGNKRMLEVVCGLKSEYRKSKRARKTVLSQMVVDDVTNRGGRFLASDPAISWGEDRRWIVADSKKARNKVSRALREMTTLERLCDEIEQMSVLDVVSGMPRQLDEGGMKLWMRFERVARKAQKDRSQATTMKEHFGMMSGISDLDDGDRKIGGSMVKSISSVAPHDADELDMTNQLKGTRDKSNNGRENQILHSTIELNCPSTIILHALRMYPPQSRQCDNFGRLPLLAAMNHVTTADDVVIKKLLCPDVGFPLAASISDARGRLPLHLGIEAGRDYDAGLCNILMAAPNALQTRDVDTHLFPFMMAAVESCSTNSLETVFRLLLESPTLIRPDI